MLYKDRCFRLHFLPVSMMTKHSHNFEQLMTVVDGVTFLFQSCSHITGDKGTAVFTQLVIHGVIPTLVLTPIMPDFHSNNSFSVFAYGQNRQLQSLLHISHPWGPSPTQSMKLKFAKHPITSLQPRCTVYKKDFLQNKWEGFSA